MKNFLFFFGSSNHRQNRSETAAVCGRCCAGKFLEVGDKMVYILIAYFIADFMYFHVCLNQQVFCGLNPYLVKILQGGSLEAVFKIPAYSVFIFSVPDLPGYISDSSVSPVRI